MYYFQHLTQKEIGEQNGWTRSTIGRHIQLVLVFPPRDENDKFAILPYFWIPEDTLELRVRRDHVPYDVWEKQGYLMTTEGNVVHYGFIEKFIERLGERFNIREIAFDRWGAVQMVLINDSSKRDAVEPSVEKRFLDFGRMTRPIVSAMTGCLSCLKPDFEFQS